MGRLGPIKVSDGGFPPLSDEGLSCRAEDIEGVLDPLGLLNALAQALGDSLRGETETAMIALRVEEAHLTEDGPDTPGSHAAFAAQLCDCDPVTKRGEPKFT
jgi:hypothetical protein